MRTVWKLKLTGVDQEFDAPAGAVAVKCAVQTMQDGIQPVMYLVCDRQAKPAKHQVRIVTTAQTIEDDERLDYVDTLTVAGPTGPLVLHIFHKQIGIITTS